MYDKGSLTSSASSSGSDENKERGNWSGKLDFLLSCIGYAVGLGNIWRFPYLCYRNGGATFLIPYLTFLLMCGIPLFFLEISFGQFGSLSPITIWTRFSPLLTGIGYGMTFVASICCVYYNIIITWTLYYLFKSFTSVLPWSECGNVWNTLKCIDSNGIRWVDRLTAKNISFNSSEDITITSNSTNVTKFIGSSSSEEYWKYHVLDMTEGIENVGGIRWELLGCLALAWVLVFLCLIKGIKSSGKVVYVTALFPYVVLFIFLVRGVTLEGAWIGLRYYLVPKPEKLLNLQVWGEAAMQIFYSVGPGWGALITMASYNKFRHNTLRDAMIVPCINCGTSVAAGFVIFSILGFLAHETGKDIETVVDQGPGLIFVVYPAAVAKMSLAPIWSVLFFLMIFMIGLDSQFGMFETLTSAMVDEFPKIRKRKMLMTVILCFIQFLIGISMVTRGGIYVLQIIDWYSSTFSLMVICFLECVIISWSYGIDQFIRDISFMLGIPIPRVFKIMWQFVTPLVVLFVFGFNTFNHTPVSYGTYKYPIWAIVIGWLIALASLIPLPICALFAYKKTDDDLPFLERIKVAIRPTSKWGPSVDKYRGQWWELLNAEQKNYYRQSIEKDNIDDDSDTYPLQVYRSTTEPV